MKRPTQRWLWMRYNRAIDQIAIWIYPKPIPIGIKIYGYEVSRLDVALVFYNVLLALVAVWFYSSWIWFPIAIGLFIMMWLWMA
jgi:hypothetical protein